MFNITISIKMVCRMRQIIVVTLRYLPFLYRDPIRIKTKERKKGIPKISPGVGPSVSIIPNLAPYKPS